MLRSGFLLAGLLLAPTLFADDELPAISEEGLHLVEDSQWAVVYVDPEADFAEFDTVMLTKTKQTEKQKYTKIHETDTKALKTIQIRRHTATHITSLKPQQLSENQTKHTFPHQATQENDRKWMEDDNGKGDGEDKKTRRNRRKEEREKADKGAK